MRWTLGELERWFLEFHSTDEARRRSGSVAAKRYVGDQADDLHQEWYLSIVSTIESMHRNGRPLPDWLDGEDSARRYVLRALDNDAIDLTRSSARQAIPLSAFESSTSTTVDISTEHDVSFRAVATATATRPADAATWQVALDEICDELYDRYHSKRLRCPGCDARLHVQICLGVVEMLRGTTSITSVTDETVDVRGGATGWGQIVYEVLQVVAPEQVARRGTRMDAATRKRKQRCGDCARSLLGELLSEHLSVEGGS